MAGRDFRPFFSEFINGHQGLTHFAAHSHHFWPDVTKDAQLQYWRDAAHLSDSKWEKIFGEIIPETQKYLANILSLTKPEQIVFASNTHELLVRLLSTFPAGKSIKVLTSDSEFHSFERQMKRLEEVGEKIGQLPKIEVHRVSVAPFESFVQRLMNEAEKVKPDLLFCSQVFFNAGLALSLRDWMTIVATMEQSHPDCLVAIDGYHGFMALPFQLGKLEGKVFYLAGSYKYVGAGEGACFMVVPKMAKAWRPSYTGWFANMSALSKHQGGGTQVSYDEDGMAFAGATMDFSAVYRLHAVLKLYQKENITVAQIHDHVQTLQNEFLQILDKKSLSFNRDNLLFHSFSNHGHFLAFQLDSEELTKALWAKLKDAKIITDYRGNILRFGFALYHHPEECFLTWKKF